MNNFCITFFTSTHQHYGLNDVDIIAMSDLLKKSEIAKRAFKLVHIKTLPGHESIAESKKDFFSKLSNTQVIETKGFWKNDDASHSVGLIQDMARVYNHPSLLAFDVVFHLENDWIFLKDNIDYEISNAIDFISTYNDIVYFRYTRDDQLDITKRLDSSRNLGDKFYLVDREFAFNPFFSRPLTMRYIANLVSKTNLHPHCEMAYEVAAKILHGKNDIFVYYNNNIVQHLGCKENYDKYISQQRVLQAK